MIRKYRFIIIVFGNSERIMRNSKNSIAYYNKLCLHRNVSGNENCVIAKRIQKLLLKTEMIKNDYLLIKDNIEKHNCSLLSED